MDVRVLWSQPSDRNWECHASVVCHKKKMEPYPLYDQARARHTLDTKTNHGVPNTCTNKQTYRKIAPEVHDFLTHLLKPALPKTDLTPVPPGKAQAHPFCRKPKIPLPQVAILGGNPACSQHCFSRLRGPHNFAHIKK